MPRLSRVLFVAGHIALVGAVVHGYAAARRAEQLDAEVRRLKALLEDMGRLREDFLATLSHELRTPLNAMLGWLQLLRLHMEDPLQRAHALEVLERNAHAQLNIVSNLLDISRIVTGKMQVAFERIDLSDIVAHTCEYLRPAANAKDVTLRAELEAIPGTVYGDHNRLQQVIWNLVTNAIKFTPAGGTITVRLRPCDTSVLLEVSDTGIGITPEVLPHIFERFRQGDSSLTRAYGGLGLGLAIVRHLVELHGGLIAAASRGSGAGATFTVRLPFQPEPQPSAWEAAASQAVRRQA